MPRLTAGIREQQARGHDEVELRCTVRHGLEELDEVEVLHQRVCELDQHLGEAIGGQRSHGDLQEKVSQASTAPAV